MSTNTIVISQGKTGSTGLFHALQKTGTYDKVFFEPKGKIPSAKKIHNKTVLSKIVLENFEDYDLNKLCQTLRKEWGKRIVLVRNPFDRIVSCVCYRGYLNLKGDNVQEYLKYLTKKQEDPSYYSCVELLDKLRILSWNNYDTLRLAERGVGHILEMLDPNSNRYLSDFAIMSYENLIDNNFSEIESYLDIGRPIELPLDEDLKGRKKVIRNKQAGDWTRWFTKEDVEYFTNNHFFVDYCKKFGYIIDRNELLDMLDTDPVITKDESINYYKRLMRIEK